MKQFGRVGRGCQGFTIIEVLMTCVILGILAAVAVPSFYVWMPNYRLKSAARDVYSSLQRMKLEAIKRNQDRTLVFSTSPSDQYQFALSGVTKTITLSDYGSGLRYGRPDGGSTVTYTGSKVTFNARGSCNIGYAYLTNQTNSSYYRVGTQTTGAILIDQWKGGAWQ